MILQYKKNLIKRVRSFTEKEDSLETGPLKANYESAIKGTTLDVYFYLLRKKNSAGVREIQRGLNLSSPSVSSYHLEKLENLDVVRKNRFGNYEISKKIDIGALNNFVIIGNFTLPRFLFYAVFVSVLFGGYILFFLTWPISVGELFAFIFGSVAVFVFWLETILCWKVKPF
ncbi:MAG: winged helix-turn-helix domain-containing protein [Candidatus Hodarchaeota archaeon]